MRGVQEVKLVGMRQAAAEKGDELLLRDDPPLRETFWIDDRVLILLQNKGDANTSDTGHETVDACVGNQILDTPNKGYQGWNGDVAK